MPAGITRKSTLTSVRSIDAILDCHSGRSEESLIMSGAIAVDKSEMLEGPVSCSAFRCSGSLNMTALVTRVGDKNQSADRHAFTALARS